MRIQVICIFLLILSSISVSFAAKHEDLLRKYRPHLYTTKKEFSPPIGVETMLENSYLVDTGTSTIINGDDGQPLKPTLENLREYNEEKYAVKLLSEYTELLGKSKAENYEKTPAVVYARAVEVPEDKILALQYFFFYAGSYTGKLIVGAQLPWHEGDTEYAQIVLDLNTLEPIGASSSIHYYGISKRWDELRFGDDGRVKMYVAQHSHATYFSPSKWPGHQAMEGNLGFGGNLMVSLRTVWDYCREDREVDYELRPLNDDHLVFTWKGRWGGKEKLHPSDDSLKAHEPGPVSFAYRNAMSDKLSMFNHPSFFYYFYFLPSAFYQKMLLSIKKVENSSIRDEMYDLVFRIGRLRAKVDTTLETKHVDLNAWQKMVLSEATPFVVLSMTQEKVEAIYQFGKDELGVTTFQKLMRKIAEQNIDQMMDHLENKNLDIHEVEDNPLNLYALAPERLLSILATVTCLEPNQIVEIYKESHSIRNDEDMTAYEQFKKIHEK